MANLKGLPPGALPWGRSVESRLDDLTAGLDRLDSSTSGVDRAVFSEFTSGQNIAIGTTGRVTPASPVAVQYVSSTGMYEVTVSLAGMTRDGAILGAGFESANVAYEVNYDIPLYGVVDQAPLGQTAWKPFSASYSTVLNGRVGLQTFTLYLYSVCNQGANSAAFVKRCRLSVKAV